MANPGSVALAVVALFAGAALGYFGVSMMLEAGSFVSQTAEQDSGFLGLGSSSSQSASVNTAAFVGLVLALAGGSALLFGARALFIAFEGRGEI